MVVVKKKSRERLEDCLVSNHRFLALAGKSGTGWGTGAGSGFMLPHESTCGRGAVRL